MYGFAVESDKLDLVRGLRGWSFLCEWRSKAVGEDDVTMLSRFRSATMRWIHRQGNLATDWLAKEAIWRVCLTGWDSCPPSSLAVILANDVVDGVSTVGNRARVG